LHSASWTLTKLVFFSFLQVLMLAFIFSSQFDVESDFFTYFFSEINNLLCIILLNLHRPLLFKISDWKIWFFLKVHFSEIFTFFYKFYHTSVVVKIYIYKIQLLWTPGCKARSWNATLKTISEKYTVRNLKKSKYIYVITFNNGR
jgi:hypothetical protein